MTLALWRSPYLLLSLAALFWAGNFVVGRAVHAAVPPVALAFWRWISGLAIVLCFVGPNLRRDLPVLLRNWHVLLPLSAFGVAAFNTLVYIGLRSTTAINALLLQSAVPLVIVLCSFALFGERPGPLLLLGVAVSFAGVLVIAGHGSPAALLGLALNRGDLWVLSGVVTYALYSVLLRTGPAVHPLSFLVAIFALGVVMLLPFYLWETLSVMAMPWSAPALVAIGYVAIFPSFLAFLCYNRGIALIGANRAGQFMHLLPVFGTVLAIVFLGEAFHAFQAFGITLIAAGIVLARVAGSAAEAEAAPSRRLRSG